MKQYIGIIRGINVGGHNKVNMKLLREALEEKKYQNVRTYIQSGNLVFRSRVQSISKIESVLSGVLKKTFDVDVPVLVRDEVEWKRTVSRNPFLKKTDDLTKLLVTFLSVKPAVADLKATREIHFPNDDFVIDGKDIYMWCRNGYGKTDIPNAFFEKKLKVTGTTRNWRTVLELEKMLELKA